ncbi:MAG: hypothetical protein HY323_07195 [Betaproteobacteria bacterium]|nr:hypothetical protein [Betaproteobacteria bacterium]
MIEYTIPADCSNAALVGRTVHIYSRARHPQHGDVLFALLGESQQVILRAAANPEAVRVYEAGIAAIRAARRAEMLAETRAADAWDRVYNEGGDGYNLYRSPRDQRDNTPWHKGDDQME